MQRTRVAIRSRFAVRILFVFTACAIVPILIFAALTYTSTRTQLREDAAAALRREAKSAAMSIIERINIGAAHLDLESIRENASLETSTSAFTRIDRLAREELDLDPSQRQHLSRGRYLLIRAPSEAGGALQLVRKSGGVYLLGTFELDFLFSPERIGDGERYWATDAGGDFIFGTGAGDETRNVVRHTAAAKHREAFDLETSRGDELAVVWPVFLKNPFDSPPLNVGMSRTHESIDRPLRDFRTSFAAALLLAVLGSLAIALRQIRLRVGPLEALVETTRELEHGNLAARSSISTGDELEVLGSTINSMASSLQHHFQSLDQLLTAADHFLAVNDREEIASLLIPAVREISGAHSATLFVIERNTSDAPTTLVQVNPENSGTPIATGGRRIPTDFANRSVNQRTPLLLRRDASDAPAEWAALDAAGDQAIETLFLVPLIDEVGKLAGVLQIEFAANPERLEIDPETRKALVLLASQAGAALKNVALIEDLRGLFEGVVKLTVEAIDEKSPYTGDHCRRVPILTELITEAACAEDQGPLKKFNLSQEEIYELNIAALLHDCGKVATPVHVMDKATKLEKISDRIDLIHARAETLRRDFEANELRREITQREPIVPRDHPASSERAQLDDDLAFIERCNIGGEFIETDDMTRLDEIRHRYRFLDRYGAEQSLLTDDEVRNLKIGRGTLNDDERKIINDHVVTTISLLEQLPFPEELKNVPSIAGAHHERIDGTGYPKGLGHEDLTMQGRILGLADVFEALTAKDRPYKPGKTLSETLQILQSMVDDGHIDRDLHEVFVRRKVYLRYATQYMDPSQIDDRHLADFESMTAPWAN